MSRLPALGPRGEGWFALQVALLAAIGGAGLVAGGQWGGVGQRATALAGSALLVIGLVLGFVAVRALDQSVSPLPRPRQTAELVQHGIYARIRHPIYAALMLVAVGWALASASWLALALCIALAVLLDLKARREEIWLRERFPGYWKYATSTKRFVPGVY